MGLKAADVSGHGPCLNTSCFFALTCLVGISHRHHVRLVEIGDPDPDDLAPQKHTTILHALCFDDNYVAVGRGSHWAANGPHITERAKPNSMLCFFSMPSTRAGWRGDCGFSLSMKKIS